MDPFIDDYSSHVRFAKMFVLPDEPELLLPDDLKRVFGYERPPIVTLSAWDRKKWPVELEITESSVCLTSGWPAFRDAYGLVNADLLYFAYDRKLHFEVRAFSRSGMEKATTVPDTVLLRTGSEIGGVEINLSNSIIESSGNGGKDEYKPTTYTMRKCRSKIVRQRGKRKIWTRNCTRGQLAKDDEENAKRLRAARGLAIVEVGKSVELDSGIEVLPNVGTDDYNNHFNDEVLALTQPPMQQDIDAEVAKIVGSDTKLDDVMLASIESSAMVNKIEEDVLGRYAGEGSNMVLHDDIDGTEAVVPDAYNGGRSFFVVVNPSMISGDFMMDVDKDFAEYELPMGISPVELELKGVGTWTLICLRTENECKIIDGLEDFAIASGVKVGDCCKVESNGEGKWGIRRFRP